MSMFNFLGRETIPPVPLTINDVRGQRCLCRARGPVDLDQPTNFLSFNSQLTNQAKQISQVAKTLGAFLLISQCSSSISHLTVFKPLFNSSLECQHVWRRSLYPICHVRPR